MRIGVLSFGDGTEREPEAVRLAEWLREQGHFVVAGESGIFSSIAAASEAERLARADCDVVLFSFAGWSPPGLAVQAALRAGDPALLTGYGEAAFFAAAEAFQEIGVPFGRALGGSGDPAAQAQIERWLRCHAPEARRRGEEAAQKLYGARYGALGSPSANDNRGSVDTARWLSQFGIYFQSCDSSELALWQERVAPERVEAGVKWLEARSREMGYDGDTVTPGPEDTRARQMRLYLAVKDYCAQEQIEFCSLAELRDGSGGQPPLRPDVPAALLNDTVDSEGAKKPLICSPGGDANGALTMQLLYRIAETPVLLAEIGSRHADTGFLDLVNPIAPLSGFAPRVEDTAPEVTFARITRRSGRYVCVLVKGELVRSSREDSSSRQSARFPGGFEAFVSAWSSSRLHAAVGDHIGALKAACEALDIEPILLG